jgi:3-oxoacyl-[acyl-carrier protein] reductase
LIEERVALITGSSRGIGRAIALDLARNGIRVVINYRSRQEAAEEVAREIGQAGGKAMMVKADVGADGEVKSMVDRVLDEWGTIDILINNAAVHRGGRIQLLGLEDWNTVIGSGLGGVFHCCRHVVPGMVEKNWGRIVNLSSYVALHGYPGDTAYGAAKSGILGFTMSLAKEVATKGVTVNAVIPGFIPTDMTRGLFNSQEKLDRELQRIPMRRPGRPEEVADAVNFLVFKGDYVTGSVIRVDGGLGM